MDNFLLNPTDDKRSQGNFLQHTHIQRLQEASL